MRTRPRTLVALLALSAATASAGASVAAASTAGGAAAPSATPAKPARHRSHTSVATWFGPGFYGQLTACGQTLTPGVIGVANRTLRCGTLVKVTYGGHSLIVPVLDRGPYSPIADWDLTSGAAAALGISDTVRIRTRVVGSVPNTPTLGLLPAAQGAAQSGGAVAG